MQTLFEYEPNIVCTFAYYHGKDLSVVIPSEKFNVALTLATSESFANAHESKIIEGDQEKFSKDVTFGPFLLH